MITELFYFGCDLDSVKFLYSSREPLPQYISCFTVKLDTTSIHKTCFHQHIPNAFKILVCKSERRFTRHEDNERRCLF